RTRRACPRLPTRARHGVAPARDERGGQRDKRGWRVRRCRRGDRRDDGDAAICDRVAGASASATLFRDTEERLPLQPEPRCDRGREKRGEEQNPGATAAAAVDRESDDGAGDRARARHGSGTITKPRRQRVDAKRPWHLRDENGTL